MLSKHCMEKEQREAGHRGTPAVCFIVTCFLSLSSVLSIVLLFFTPLSPHLFYYSLSACVGQSLCYATLLMAMGLIGSWEITALKAPTRRQNGRLPLINAAASGIIFVNGSKV